MSYPNTDPVQLRIIDHIVATLQAAAPPQTAYKFQDVRAWSGNQLENIAAQPAALVIPIVETSGDQRMLLYVHELDVSILISLRTQDWKREIVRLATDVRVALLADWTRGGIAENTVILSTEIFDSTESAPLAGAQINARVRYRTLFTDPSEAH